MPDGLKIAADGRLWVTTFMGGGVDILRPDGTIEDFLETGGTVLNCIFHGGDLIITDMGDITELTAAAPMDGRLWRVRGRGRGHAAVPGGHRSCRMTRRAGVLVVEPTRRVTTISRRDTFRGRGRYPVLPARRSSDTSGAPGTHRKVLRWLDRPVGEHPEPAVPCLSRPGPRHRRAPT